MGPRHLRYAVASRGCLRRGSQEYHVGAFNIPVVPAMTTAITDWNNSLRGAPDSLSKYPFHYLDSYNFNSSSNIQVLSVLSPSDLIQYCGTGGAWGCIRDNNLIGQNYWLGLVRPFHIYIT